MARARRGLRSVTTATAAAPAVVRCAVYTRKSTDEGLDREFNTLDAQREACENFIASMKGEGWSTIADTYDDGGFSGGTLKRPALDRLIEGIKAGEIDCVVVYKLDRLSRSMRDYLNLLAFFDDHDVQFVSVTQQFNTGTIWGRMTLKQLLLFAEFERDMIAERTRDKARAARRKGKWTGGRPPLGYDLAPEGGRLVANPDEAEQVRATFGLYADNPSVIGVAQEANRRGWRQKLWIAKTGRRCGGGVWNKTSMRRLLTDPLYIGKQKLGDETFKGEHKAIVSRKLFDKVQRLFDDNRSTGGASTRNSHGYLLRGLVRCSVCESAMVPSWTRSRTRLYRYYRCSHAEKNGHAACPSKMIPANKVETFVVDQIKRIGADPQLQDETFRQAVGQIKAQRRGLKAEKKRVERDLVTVRDDVERLVRAVSRVTGPAADAVAAELEKTQQRLTTLENRLGEIEGELADLNAQVIDRDHLALALAEFNPIWDVLLTPERERVLRLLIERIEFDGTAQKLTINWRLGGFGELAAEVGT